MGVGGGTMEKVLGGELVCISLLICGRGWEKGKEVLCVAFLVLFLQVNRFVGVVGVFERAGVGRVSKTRGSERTGGTS